MFSQGYIIDSQICVAVLYLLYLAFLHRRVTHSVARAYLLTMLPVALILPLISIPLLPAPVIQLYAEDGFVATAITYTPQETTNYLMWVYLTGVAIMSAWLLIGTVRLAIMFRKNRPEKVENLQVVFTEQKLTAYSVFNRIFISSSFRGSESLHTLLAHEECHIRHRHTWDLIYISLAKIIFWFNPAVWHTAVLMRQVHEYEADEEVIDKGYSTQNYINLLILSEAGISPEFASPLSYSLTKKRLTMLAKKQRAASRKRLLLTLPVIAVLMMAFSLTTRAAVVIPAEKEKPLIIVNGVEWQKKLNDISPDEIASMNVIKGDAAIEKYGKKAKDGAIEITLRDKDGNTQQEELKIEGFKLTGKFDKADDEKIIKSIITIKSEDGKANVVTVSKELPLTILDGVEISSSYDVDANTIASVTVLKGEKATAEYGEKGKNGVIIMTSKDKAEPQSGETPFVLADVMPQFEGGDVDKFRNWVATQLSYPAEARANGIQGTVVVKLVVEQDGSVSNVRVLRGIDKQVDEEAVRAVMSSPKWTPGTNKGKLVRVTYTLPIMFRL